MSPRSLPVVALVLALGTLIATMRVVAGGETWSDARYHVEIAPPRLAAARAIQAGELPQWWEGTGLGVPLAGEPSHGAMAPASWLATTPHGLDLVMVAHLFVLALGIAVWARGTTSELAAIAAALLVVTTGVVGGALLRGALPALAWLPWLGAAARARMPIAIGATLGAIGLGGQLAILVDGIALALVIGGPRRDVLIGIAAGLAIACAQWLPALLALPHAAGTEVTGLPMARLIELVVPGGFGGPEAWAPSLYVGAPLFALAAVRAVARPLLVFVAGLVVVVFVAGRGPWPFGPPELHLAVLAVVLGPLAADGIDALLDGDRRAWRVLAIGGGFALVAFVAMVAAGRDAALDGGMAIACLALALLVSRGELRALALAALVAPGFGASHALVPTEARDAVDDLPRWAELARDEQPPRRVYRPPSLHAGERDPHESLRETIATLGGATPDRWGITAARSDNPARAAAHDAVWAGASHGGGVLLDRFGVGLAVLPASVTSGMTVLAKRGERWALVQLPSAPVASVVYGARFVLAPEPSHLFTLDGKAALPRGEIVVAGTGTARASEAPPKPCRIKAWEPGAIDLVCVAEQPAFAVVSSSAADGWEVTVDGAPATVLDADLLRRAVAIPAGARVIAWRYTAPGLLAGLVIAGAGVAGLSLLRIRRRASRATT